MIEIIPNWHPVFVHFTVALLVTASILQLIVMFIGHNSLAVQWGLVARWNLWLGSGFMVITVIAGIIAFNSVEHDTPSHLAMIEHRNWALATTLIFLAVTVWSVLRKRKEKPASSLFVSTLLVAMILLLATAWHGGELVYRYGLGVMSLPSSGAHGHAEGEVHEHAVPQNDVNHAHDVTENDLHSHDDDLQPALENEQQVNEGGVSDEQNDEIQKTPEKVHTHADGQVHEH